MEASMHGSFDKSGETVKRVYLSWGIGLFVLPMVVLGILVGMAITQPDFSKLISEAAQAEFATSIPASESTQTQFTQPGNPMRTVKAN
jgi:hypothetical protein